MKGNICSASFQVVDRSKEEYSWWSWPSMYLAEISDPYCLLPCELALDYWEFKEGGKYSFELSTTKPRGTEYCSFVLTERVLSEYGIDEIDSPADEKKTELYLVSEDTVDEISNYLVGNFYNIIPILAKQTKKLVGTKLYLWCDIISE